MAEHYLITTFKKNQHFIWFFVFVVVCKSSSKHLQAKQLLLKSNQVIPLKTSRLKSKIRKVFHQINNVWSLLVNNSKMVVHFRITIFKKNQHSILFFVSVVVCKFSLKHLLAKQLLWKSNQVIQLKTSRLKFKIKKVFHQINNVWSLLVNN